MFLPYLDHSATKVKRLASIQSDGNLSNFKSLKSRNMSSASVATFAKKDSLPLMTSIGVYNSHEDGESINAMRHNIMNSISHRIQKNFQSLHRINEAKARVNQRQSLQEIDEKYDIDAQRKKDEALKVNDRYLKFTIPNLNYLRKIKWDIDSPRFKEAQLNLGYQDDDLLLKHLGYFKFNDLEDIKIVKMRYQHHLFQVKQNLNEVIEERLKIKGETGGDITTTRGAPKDFKLAKKKFKVRAKDFSVASSEFDGVTEYMQRKQHLQITS